MSWSSVTRRVVYLVGLVLATGLAFWAANQTLLADNHITISQISPNSATATASQAVRSWGHTFSSSTVADCSTVNYPTSNDQISASLTQTITWISGVRRDGNYLCVRTLVDNDQNEYAYSSPLRIDLAGPAIRFESSRSTAGIIEATASDYNNLHTQAAASTAIEASQVLSGVSFRYAILSNSSDCTVRNINIQTINTSLVLTSTDADNLDELKVSVPVTAADHGKYVCLKSTDQFGNVSYQLSPRLDTKVEGVKITINTASSQLRLTASEVLDSVWAASTTGTTCDFASLSSGTATATGVTTVSLSYTAASDTLACFYLLDRQANGVGYSYAYDTQSPSVPQIIQSARTIIATASDTDQRDAAQRGDTAYPQTWGVKAWHSYFIDSASTDLAATLTEACDADSYGRSGTDTNSQTWRVYRTGSATSQVVLTAAHERYEAICFRATDYADRHSYGSIALGNFDSTNPIIRGERTRYQRDITLSLAGSNLKVLTWRWVKIATGTSACGIDQMPVATAPTTNNKIRVTDSDIGSLFCVEALLSNNNRIYQIVEAGNSQIDMTAPQITARVERNRLQASATDALSGVKATTWEWQSIHDPANSASSCQAEDIADPVITRWNRGSRTNTLTPSRDGRNAYICFRVADNVGNLGYGLFIVGASRSTTDTTPPTVTVRRQGLTVIASSTASDLPSIPDWRYLISQNPTCDESVITSGGSSIGYGRSVQLVSGDDVWVCFQVRDASGNAGHGRIRVDLAGPVITVSQSGAQVTASSNEAASNWIYFRSDNQPDYCSADANFNFNQRQIFVGRSISSLSADDVGKYICFRAADAQGNYGVNAYQISGPINQPSQTPTLTISFAQSPTQLVASTNRAVSAWRYLVYETAPTSCDSNNVYFIDGNFVGQGNSVSLVATDNGRYYCFEATAADGTKAYASHRVSITATPNENQPKPIDELVVTINQVDSNQLLATANRAVSAWRYLVYEDAPANCDSTNSYFAADNGRVGRLGIVYLTVADEGRYYCFEATATDGRKAYASHKVTPLIVADDDDDQAPAVIVSVSVSRQDNMLIASADRPISQWLYLVYASQPTCDQTNTDFEQTSTRSLGHGSNIDLNPASFGHYYCFRAKSTYGGHFGYAVHRVVQPIMTEDEEEEVEVEEEEEETPQDITPPADNPEIKISRTDKHLIAKADQPIVAWRYLIYADQPNCDGSNNHFDQASSTKVGQSNRATWVAADHDRYYCFRAQTADGRTGYALYRIPAQPSVAEPINRPTTPTTTPATPTPKPDQAPADQTDDTSEPQPDPAKPTDDDSDDQTAGADDPVTPSPDPGPTTPDADNDDAADPEKDDDDGLPWLWITGGAALAVIVVLLLFRPRKNHTDEDETDQDDPDQDQETLSF